MAALSGIRSRADHHRSEDYRRLCGVGRVVRVELVTTTEGTSLEAEISRDLADRLQLKIDETVYARPRRVHLFVEDYQI